MMTSTRTRLALAAIFAVAIVAAPAAADQRGVTEEERESAELLRIHRSTREAHFETDVDLLLARTADPQIYVRDGKIRQRSKAELRDQLERYFRSARYDEWDDLEPPIIRVSTDGTLGWMICRVKVRRSQPTSTGVERQEFVYAGIHAYEKRDGEWMEVANVSTFEPRQ
jgi:hypothetical protein